MTNQNSKSDPKEFPVKLIKGYWPKAEVKDLAGKAEKGAVITLPLAEAKAVIAAGLAVRADDLPEN